MKKSIFLLVVMAAVFLSGCIQFMPAPTEPSAQTPTGDNSEITQVSTLVGYGIDTEGKLDSYGLYYPYSGGEMELSLFVQASGMQEMGVTVLLFLNGQPQPYALSGGETAYMNTVYPEDLSDNVFPIRFTPISGSAGDTASLCVMFLPALGYLSDNADSYWYNGGHAKFHMAWIKLEQTPPQSTLPDIPDRALSIKLENEEDGSALASSTLGSGSRWGVMRKNINIEGNATQTPGFSSLQRMYLTLDLNPKETHYVTIFVDDQPVLLDGKTLRFEADSAQDILAEIDIDASGQRPILFAVILQESYSRSSALNSTYPNNSNWRIFAFQIPE